MSDAPARRPPQRRHLAVVHPTEPAVGLVAAGAGWALPAFEARWWRWGDDPPAGLPEPLLPALRDALARLNGAPTAGPAWAPFAQRGATAALDAALSADPIARGLAALRADHPRALLQRRGWPLSSVWSNDEVFLKVVPPRWASEGPVTAWLASLAPGRVPRVVAHGQATAPGGPLAWNLQAAVANGAFDGDAVPRTAAAIGDIVRRVAPDLAAGVALGLADRRPGVVAAGLHEVWASPELASLTESERAALPELDVRWRRRLEALDEAGLPPVLVHGDLHPGNVLPGASGRGGDTVIDWTDAAVGWPGVDLLTLLGFDHPLGDAAAEGAIAAYVDAAGAAVGAAGVRVGLAAAPPPPTGLAWRRSPSSATASGSCPRSTASPQRRWPPSGPPPARGRGCRTTTSRSSGPRVSGSSPNCWPRASSRPRTSIRWAGTRGSSGRVGRSCRSRCSPRTPRSRRRSPT